MKAHAHRVAGVLIGAPLFYKIIAGTCVLFAALFALIGWQGYTRITALETRNTVLEARIASTTELMLASIEEVQSVLGGELDGERARLADLQERLAGFQQEVGVISNNVSTLDKLTRTDEELLQKYSRVFFLNEHYVPSDVIEVPKEFKYSEQRSHTIHAQVYPHLESMLKAAAAEKQIQLYVFSGYRPFDEQKALNNQYTVTYGAGTANQFSADQGYSEHQLGTTVDLITTGMGGALSGFDRTPGYQWLLENAHRFGFILSYPKGNQHYVFEPWHWRFVGVQLATTLHDSGKNFYDMDQRDIDAYLVHLFE